jgi:Tfp pilus assembly protein PilV
MKNNRLQLGQGLIEVVFSMGIIVLVLTGVVALMTSSLNSRTLGFDRKKAAELGQKVMDQIIEEKKQHPENFWNRSDAYWTANVGPTMLAESIGYPGYFYAIGASQIDTVPGCDTGGFVCVEMTVGVGWSAATNQNLSFSRFFSKL